MAEGSDPHGAASDDPLVRFFERSGTDPDGRTLDDLLNLEHSELESDHRYIQWLFPTPDDRSTLVLGNEGLANEYRVHYLRNRNETQEQASWSCVRFVNGVRHTVCAATASERSR